MRERTNEQWLMELQGPDPDAALADLYDLLVRGGYLHDEPAVALVAEVLSDLEAGERRPQPQGPRPVAPDE